MENNNPPMFITCLQDQKKSSDENIITIEKPLKIKNQNYKLGEEWFRGRQ